MPNSRGKSIALVAIVVALIACSNFPLTPGLTNNRLANNSDVVPRLLAAQSRFSFKLYDQILKQDTGKNTFVSPASIMLALAMTYNGAVARLARRCRGRCKLRG